MALTETYTDFFDTDEHAITAVYTAAGGSPVNVVGILDKGYVEVAGIEAFRPMFTCASSDISGVAQDDALTADGGSYKVASVEQDGTGVTTLILKNA